MSTRPPLALLVALSACSAAHPTDDRYPNCEPGQRCPVSDHACLPTQTMGMRCLPNCMNVMCLETETCLPIGFSGTLYNCFPAGLTEAGEPCSAADECVVGAACTGVSFANELFTLPNDSPPRCRVRCDVADGGAPACPDGQFCTNLGGPLNFHVCIEPCDPATGAGCAADEICASGTRCADAAAQQMACGGACALGQICGLPGCYDPVDWAAMHPPT